MFEILIILNLFWGHVRSRATFGRDWFSNFDVYWILTNKQTDKQASKVYLCMALGKVEKDVDSLIKP